MKQDLAYPQHAAPAQSARASLTAGSAVGERAAPTRYALDVPAGQTRALARGWLGLAIGALILSGFFSILLVLGRTPGIGRHIPIVDLFHVALVVHVDLSVLVWFVAFLGLAMTIAGTRRWLGLGWASVGLASLGAVMLSLAPFVEHADAVMSNYVPVLDGRWFLSGLAVFGAGFVLAAVRALASIPGLRGGLDAAAALRFGCRAAALSAVVALLSFVWSFAGVPLELFAKTYYELLFWGPGHVLQFTWTLLLVVAWLWLAGESGLRVPLSPRLAVLMLLLGVAALVAVPAIYLAWPVAAVEHQRMFTWLMRAAGGLPVPAVAIAVAIALVRGERRRDAASAPLKASLVASMVLFASGGLIGFAIQGSDVRVPAHYHGSIVGITLALMGLAYALLPRLGLGTPKGRLATLQPQVYAVGQMMHIVGLVWSGGYGVARKVAGAEQVLSSPQEVAGMALMGVGGLIAIVGGMLFAVVTLRAILRR